MINNNLETYNYAKETTEKFTNEKSSNMTALNKLMELMKSSNIELGGEVEKISKNDLKKEKQIQIDNLNKEINFGKFRN